MESVFVSRRESDQTTKKEKDGEMESREKERD